MIIHFKKELKRLLAKWNFLTSFKNGKSPGKSVINVEAGIERKKATGKLW